jgi:hypothetical protein
MVPEGLEVMARYGVLIGAEEIHLENSVETVRMANWFLSRAEASSV